MTDTVNGRILLVRPGKKLIQRSISAPAKPCVGAADDAGAFSKTS